MRICIATDNLYGGVATHIQTLLQMLVNDGHDVSLVFYRARGAGCPHVDFSVVSGLSFEACGDGDAEISYFELIRRVWRRRPDIIVWPKGGPYNGSIRFDIFARIFTRAYLTIEYNMPPLPRGGIAGSPERRFGRLVPSLGLWWRWPLLRMRLRSRIPNRIIAISPAVSRFLIAEGYPEDKVVSVPIGAPPPAELNSSMDLRSSMRARWGIDYETFVFGNRGRVVIEQKRLDVLLRAYAEVRQHTQRPTLLMIVGEGPDVDRLHALAAELGIAPWVKFTGDFPDHDTSLAPFDTFVGTSDFEGFWLAPLEAMMRNKFCVLTRVGAAEEMIPDSGYGLLVQHCDAHQVARAMIQALELDPSELMRKAAVAGERARKLFDGAVRNRELCQLLVAYDRKSRLGLEMHYEH